VKSAPLILTFALWAEIGSEIVAGSSGPNQLKISFVELMAVESDSPEFANSAVFYAFPAAIISRALKQSLLVSHNF